MSTNSLALILGLLFAASVCKCQQNNFLRVSLEPSSATHNIAYFGDVKVGDKSFALVFDTLASETWLAYQYTLNFRTINKGGYRVEDSKSGRKLSRDGKHEVLPNYKDTTTTFEGSLYKDTFSISSERASFSKIKFRKEFYGVKTFNSADLDYAFQFDSVVKGAISLSLSNSTAFGFKSFLNDVVHGISEATKRAVPRVFSFWFPKDPFSAGELTIGGLDQSRCQNTLRFFNLMPGDQWAVAADDVQFGLTSTKCQANGCRVSFDTGSQFIVGPRDDVQKIYAAFNALRMSNGLYYVDCNYPHSKNLTFSVSLDRMSYVIHPESYIYKDGSMCYLPFKVHQKSDWILGTSFLKTYYSVFDADKRRVGLAYTA